MSEMVVTPSSSRAHSRSDAFLLTFVGKPVLGRRIGILVTPDQTVGAVLAQLEARHDSAEDFSRLDALLFTAMDWIFIPAYCFALP